MLVEKHSPHGTSPLAAQPVPPAEQREAPGPRRQIQEQRVLASLATGRPWAV